MALPSALRISLSLALDVAGKVSAAEGGSEAKGLTVSVAALCLAGPLAACRPTRRCEPARGRIQKIQKPLLLLSRGTASRG